MPNMSLEKVKMPEQEPEVRNKNFKEVDGAVFHLLKIHGILK